MTNLPPIEELNWLELYPDSKEMKEAKEMLHPENMVIDLVNEPPTPDSDCIVIQWTEVQGKFYKYRFRKNKPEDITESLMKLRKKRAFAKARQILTRNFPDIP